MAMRAVLLAIVVLMTQADRPADATAPSTNATRAEVRRMVVEEALRSDRVPVSLALAVAEAESDFVADAVSPAGARGVMQIMPATARGEFGVSEEELWDPRLNIRLGVTFLEGLIDPYDGRWDLALSHYNGGSRVGSGTEARVIPATRAYVDKVLATERRYASQGTAIAAADRAADMSAATDEHPRHKAASSLPRRAPERRPQRPRVVDVQDEALAAARIPPSPPIPPRPHAVGAQVLLDRIASRKARFQVLLGDG